MRDGLETNSGSHTCTQARPSAAPHDAPEHHRRPSRAIVAIALLLPTLLVGGWLAADALQPTRYSPMRQTVSVTAGYAGNDRWIMTGVLYAIGACYLIVAATLTGAGRPARIGLLVAGVAGIGIAANPVPMHGPDLAHDLWTAIGAVTITVLPAVAIRRRAVSWPQRLGPALGATLVFVLLSGWLVIAAKSGTWLGLAERASSSIEAAWPAMLAVGLRLAGTSPGRSRVTAHPSSDRSGGDRA